MIWCPNPWKFPRVQRSRLLLMHILLFVQLSLKLEIASSKQHDKCPWSLSHPLRQLSDAARFALCVLASCHAIATRSALVTVCASHHARPRCICCFLNMKPCLSERQRSYAVLPNKLALTPAWLLKSEKFGLPAHRSTPCLQGHHTSVSGEHCSCSRCPQCEDALILRDYDGA